MSKCLEVFNCNTPFTPKSDQSSEKACTFYLQHIKFNRMEIVCWFCFSFCQMFSIDQFIVSYIARHELQLFSSRIYTHPLILLRSRCLRMLALCFNHLHIYRRHGTFSIKVCAFVIQIYYKRDVYHQNIIDRYQLVESRFKNALSPSPPR